jgi:DNA-binding transcriptional ArsR family regulator
MNVFPMNDKTLELVARRFHVLGETYRLRILQVLTRNAMTVGELVKKLDGNQPNVSKHLQILYQAGIVGRRREGTNIIYSLKDPSVFMLCELVHRGEQSKPRELKAMSRAIAVGNPKLSSIGQRSAGQRLQVR